MGRCYACGDEMSKSTHRAAVRLGYLGSKARPTKYQKWGMTMRQLKVKPPQKSTEKKKNNNTLLYKNGL